ncbi:MAG: right-handed parallel beta-helix repeat-containing protein, partial [Planctomycetes bacterium]|nr:right-handed parallel beta-helix repeat-containing protein [Planctomycetota bacterium]
MYKSRLSLILLCIWILIPSISAARDILNVPSQDHPTIASAVAAAEPGALILVAPGFYRENITINRKTIELKSTHGPYKTMIDGMGNAPVITFSGTKETRFTLIGFTLINGKGNPAFFKEDKAGGLNLLNGHVFVQGNIIFGCTGLESAGICCTADGIIRDNLIAFNFAMTKHAGACLSEAEIDFVNNYLVGNYSGSESGGVFVLSQKKPIRVLHNVFVENWSFMGGAMQVKAGSPLIEGNLFYHNRGCRSGGVLCSSNASRPLIKGNLFRGNWGCFGAGILSLYGGNPVIDGNHISGNTTINVFCIGAPNPDFRVDKPDNRSIPPFSGAGVCCWSKSNATLINNVIVDNIARHRGGGVAVLESTAVLVNNTICNNESKWDAAGLYCDEKSTAEVYNSIFRMNRPEQVTSERIKVSSCNVEGGCEGEGICDHDPMWVDPDHLNFHLLPGSPCIDAGSSDCAHLPDHDMDDDHRPQGAGIDLGADEFLFPQTSAEHYFEHFFNRMTIETGCDQDSGLNAGLAVL